MSLPDDFQYNAGIFAFYRAKAIEKALLPICGSPIEVHFACAFITTVEGMGGRIKIIHTDEEMEVLEAGFFLYPQKQIGKHRVDFLIGRKGIRPIVAECDGRDFHHSTRDQIERDRKRDAELEAAGFRVLRYPGTQIHNQEWQVVSDALHELDPEFQLEYIRSIAGFL